MDGAPSAESVPDWTQLVVLMALGNGPDPTMRGIVVHTEPSPCDEGEPADFEVDGEPYRLRSEQLRVFKRGSLARRERLDGTPISIHGADTVWTWREGETAPIAHPARTMFFGGPDDALTRRRALEDWQGDDFTRPTGPAVPTTFLGRRAWQVDIAPPAHKLFPLTLAIDAATGLVLSQRNSGWRSATEWVELELDADLDDELFTWSGPTRPQHDHRAEHEREMAKRRDWLAQQGIRDVTVELPIDMWLNEWHDDGSFHATLQVAWHGSVVRRPNSDEPWDDNLNLPFRYEWSSGGWDWLVGTEDELTDQQLDRVKRSFSS